MCYKIQYHATGVDGGWRDYRPDHFTEPPVFGMQLRAEEEITQIKRAFPNDNFKVIPCSCEA